MTNTTAALVGGVTGSVLALAGLMVWKKLAVLDPFVENVEAAAGGDAFAQSEMARRARQVSQNLETLATSRTELIAQMTAEKYLADQYGLTAERIAGMKRLAAVFGV